MNGPKYEVGQSVIVDEDMHDNAYLGILPEMERYRGHTAIVKEVKEYSSENLRGEYYYQLDIVMSDNYIPKWDEEWLKPLVVVTDELLGDYDALLGGEQT